MINKDTLAKLYGPGRVEEEYQRYVSLSEGMKDCRLFSAPGRTELGGNHTDHNRGRVLAAAVHMDAVAAVVPRGDKTVRFRSTGFPDVQVDLNGLSPIPQEQGMTEALVRGVAAGFARRGVDVGGFDANAASTAVPGTGISSSAAVEVLFAVIFNTLYAGEQCSALEIAQISQNAENEFFGKPSGLMDQAASAFGGAVAIDFADPALPLIEKIQFEPMSAGFALCVVNTRGSHADLTPDYAAIPREMNAVARHFGKTFLREVELSAVLASTGELRRALGDRTLLRAIHFFNENRRAQTMAELLQKRETGYMEQFLNLVNESGDSSWELLQNLYPPQSAGEQSLAVALAVTREFFRAHGMKSACRVHGGGFAGTIQAYIPVEGLNDYRLRMEALFGEGTLTVLRIRQTGAVEIK